ncbi:MAG: hypothetical protein Q7S32_03350 [bacterium]|nr:hypothetical protein [bacterium]
MATFYTNDPTKNAGAFTTHDPTAAQGGEAGGGVIKSVAGVAFASIKKISGVAIASVKKVSGVAASGFVLLFKYWQW